MTSPARIAFLGSSGGLCALTLANLAGQGPGWAISSGLALGWGALVTNGVFFPWLKMYGDIVCRGPSGERRVALTFDDGPNPETTPKVLAALARSRHRATFFVLGEKVRRHPEVARAIHEQGHALALHGDVHDRLHSFRTPWRVRDELVRAQDSVERAASVRPLLFRPPIGHTTPATLHGARLAKVTPIGWSARGYDGVRGRSSEAVQRRLAASLSDGAIVLLHDASERDDFEPVSVGAMREILGMLDARGFTSVRLDAWLAPEPAPAAPSESSLSPT